MRIVVVTGSRAWSDAAAIHSVLEGADALLVGDCPTGADAIAFKYAHDNDMLFSVLVADWDKYGRTGPTNAGYMRNQALADRAAQEREGGMPVHCHAFLLPKSNGTRDCAARLRKHGFHVEEHRP